MTTGGGKEKGGTYPLELVLARLLRIGSLLAAGLLSAGIAGMLLGQGVLAPRLINAGLVVLLGTPVMRVVAAGVVFVREREWHFALFCLVVLVAIAAGIFLGGGYGG